jgi:hypothetical protein
MCLTLPGIWNLMSLNAIIDNGFVLKFHNDYCFILNGLNMVVG